MDPFTVSFFCSPHKVRLSPMEDSKKIKGERKGERSQT